MRLASKGLGKITLPFRFTEAKITEAPDYIVLEGLIKEKKVNWTYRAELEDSDILNFLLLARNPAVQTYMAEQAGLRIFTRAASTAINLVLHPIRRVPSKPQDAPAPAQPHPAAAPAPSVPIQSPKPMEGQAAATLGGQLQ